MAKTIVLRYTGKKKIATLNQIISPWKWATAKQYYRREFLELLNSQKIPKFKAFALEVTYNTKHDPDNLVAVIKFFIDTFRELGFVKNDTKKYYKYLKIEADSTLPKVTLEFKIIPQDGSN